MGVVNEMTKAFKIVAVKDKEAGVWVVEYSDIPGLVTEARTKEELQENILELVPVLLELNAHLLPPGRHESIPIELLTGERTMLEARHVA